MRASTAWVAFAAATVSAQTSQQTYPNSLNMTLANPDSVSIQQRAQWCGAQLATCDILCGTNTDENSCNSANLQYGCICHANESTPGLQYYTQTMPTFICYELFSQCNVREVGNKQGQDDCEKNIKSLCGTVNPPTTPVGGATTTASATASATDLATSTSSTAVSSTALAAPTLAPAGNGVAAAAAVIGALAFFI